MEQYIQAFSHYKRDHWVALLPLTEYAYHNSVYHTTQIMSFWASNHYHPPMQLNTLNVPTHMKPNILADATVSEIKKTHRPLHEIFLEGQVQQSKYTSSKNVIFEIENNVVLATYTSE